MGMPHKFFLTLMLLGFSFGAQAQSLSIDSKSASSISGTASASSGDTISRIDLAIRLGSLYWNGSAFSSGYKRVLATSFNTSATSPWSYSISPALPAGAYSVSARAIDSGGTASPMATTVLVVDNVDPMVSITSSAASGISGTASDNETKITRVQIALRDTSQRYWDGTSFTPGYKRVPATSLLANGNWSLTLSGLAPDRYFVGVFAFDLANNYSTAGATFVVADNIRPTSTISSTTNSTLAGTASDNIAIDRVELAISNSSGLFWDGLGFGAYARVPASLTGPVDNKNWTYSFSPPLASGTYALAVLAFDTAGNVQIPFTRQSFTTAPPLKIMALGDSITEGYDWPGDGTNQNIKSYREEFEFLMDGTSCSYVMVGGRTDNLPSTSYQSPHEGYSGRRASQFLSNSPNISQIMSGNNIPDIVLVHLGSNDIFGGVPLSTTLNSVTAVVDEILVINPQATVLLANVIPWFNTNSNQNNPNVPAAIAQLGNDIISWLQADPRPNVRLANVRNGFSAAMMQNDLIHPNAAGEAHIADAFFDAVDNSGRCGAPF